MGRTKGSKNQATEERETRATASRDADVRASDERDNFADANEAATHIPPEEWPEGMTYRWVRVEATGAYDKKNWAQMTRVGWRAVPRTRHEDRYPFVELPGMPDSAAGVIEYGGLILCERPTRLVDADRKRQQQKTIEAQQSIASYVEGGNSMIPRFDQSGPVQYERGVAAFKE